MRQISCKARRSAIAAEDAEEAARQAVSGDLGSSHNDL